MLFFIVIFVEKYQDPICVAKLIYALFSDCPATQSGSDLMKGSLLSGQNEFKDFYKSDLKMHQGYKGKTFSVCQIIF